MRIRNVLIAGVAAGTALLASTATAAPTLVISDAKGDAKGNQAAFDIHSVSFETTRASTARNAPLKDLRIVMQLGAAPNVQPGTSYQVLGEHAACGTFFAYVYWGGPDLRPTTSVQFAECGEPDDLGQESFRVETTARIDGSKIVFSVPVRSLPREVAAGSLFEGLIAYTAVTEPTAGYSPVDFAPDQADDAVSIDYAKAAKPYKFGS